MTTTTLNTMLPGFGRFIGAFIGTFSTTTNIATNTALISTGLTSYFEDDDQVNDSFVYIKGTNNDGVSRSVLDHTGSTGALDLRGVALSAESGSVDFDLYRYDPSQLTNALNDGIRSAFPSLYVHRYDRTHYGAEFQKTYARPTSIEPGYVRKIFVENRIPANTFADNIAKSQDIDFEGDLSDWTTANITLTAEVETTSPDNMMVFAGQQSGKHVVGASSLGTSYISVDDPTNYDGEEINLTIWVYCRTASRVSAAVSLDSGTAVIGSTHSGGGWERLSVSTVMGAVATSIRVGVHATSGTALTFYGDELIATAGHTEQSRPSEEPLSYWREEGGDLYIPYTIPASKQIVVEGMGLLSSVTSGTDTVEIGGTQLQRLYAYAATEFFQGDIDQLNDAEQQSALRKLTRFRNRIDSGQGMMASISKRKVPVY
jgi:hypothetical protein